MCLVLQRDDTLQRLTFYVAKIKYFYEAILPQVY